MGRKNTWAAEVGDAEKAEDWTAEDRHIQLLTSLALSKRERVCVIFGVFEEEKKWKKHRIV